MRNIGWYNGEIKPLEKLKIPVSDRCVYFGDGVYDAVYARGGKAYLADEHIDRLMLCANGIGIYPGFGKDRIKNIISELLSLGECEDYFIYMQISRGVGVRNHFSSDLSEPSLLIMMYERSVAAKDKEIDMITADDMRHGYCAYKTLNLLPNILAMDEAAAQGADGVIFCKDDHITECGNCNLFIIEKGAVYTPFANGEILEGVQRRKAIEKCAELGIRCAEDKIGYCRMMNADEVVVTSAGQLFNRVKSINGIPVGGRGGRVFDSLQGAIYGDFERFVG